LPISPPLRLFGSDARCASNAMGFGLNKLPRAADRTGRNVCGHEIPRACLGIVRQSLKPGLAFSRPKHVAAKLGYPAARRLQERFRRDSGVAMAPVSD